MPTTTLYSSDDDKYIDLSSAGKLSPLQKSDTYEIVTLLSVLILEIISFQAAMLSIFTTNGNPDISLFQ